MLIIFLGPPGAGKGTQSKRLMTSLGLEHLSTGEMLRKAKQEDSELGQLAAQYMDGGSLVPDPLVVGIVAERLSQRNGASQGYLFDGFPRTLNQARELDTFLADAGSRIDLVLALDCDEKELARRMQARSAIERRADDSPETIRRRFEVYRTQTSPLIEYYRRQGVLEPIDALGTPDEVFQKIMEAVERHRPANAPRSSATA